MPERSWQSLSPMAASWQAGRARKPAGMCPGLAAQLAAPRRGTSAPAATSPRKPPSSRPKLEPGPEPGLDKPGPRPGGSEEPGSRERQATPRFQMRTSLPTGAPPPPTKEPGGKARRAEAAGSQRRWGLGGRAGLLLLVGRAPATRPNPHGPSPPDAASWKTARGRGRAPQARKVGVWGAARATRARPRTSPRLRRPLFRNRPRRCWSPSRGTALQAIISQLASPSGRGS